MYQGNIYRFAVFVLLVGWLAVALLVAGRDVREAAQANDAPPPETLASQLSDITAHNRSGVPESTHENTVGSQDTASLFVATIRRPDGPPRIDAGVVDPQGRSGTVACSTCHSVREPNFANRAPADLDQFHQGMTFTHGSITCYSCHNPNDADTLRLADSTTVEYVDVMTLCAQCHGAQYRDYQHGAHGGMNGYWDLSRGPQTRNNCIDCHDPHVPAFPKMTPTFKPRDRFLSPPADKDHGAAVRPFSRTMAIGFCCVNEADANESVRLREIITRSVSEGLDVDRITFTVVPHLRVGLGSRWLCGLLNDEVFLNSALSREVRRLELECVRDPAAYASRLTENCDDPIRLLNLRWAV